jgi:DNA-binding NarL/FixJ family response regulator
MSSRKDSQPARGQVSHLPQAKRVLIVDDHPMTRRGLAELIGEERDLTVCGEADNVGSAVEAMKRLQPDLVLVDITLPGKSGLALLKEVPLWAPAARALVLSMHDESLYAERVLRAGGHGYIMKNAGGERLLEAIRRVLTGNTYVSAQVSSRIVDSFAGRSSQSSESALSRLTDREFDVFQLIGQGLATAEIGQRLHLSPKTIDSHRLHIKQKLKLDSLPSLMRFAVRWAATQEMI